MTTAQIFGKIFTWAGYGLFGLAGIGALLILAVNGYAIVEDYQHGRFEWWHVIWGAGGAVLLGAITAGIGWACFAIGQKLLH
jgi:hypothetical protein